MITEAKMLGSSGVYIIVTPTFSRSALNRSSITSVTLECILPDQLNN